MGPHRLAQYVAAPTDGLGERSGLGTYTATSAALGVSASLAALFQGFPLTEHQIVMDGLRQVHSGVA